MDNDNINSLTKQLFESLMIFTRNIKESRNYSYISSLSFTEVKVFFAMAKIYEQNSEKNCVQMSEISDLLGISKPALSQIVNKLEDKDLVERVFLKDDRRATYLKVTGNGVVIFKKHQQQVMDSMSQIVERMGEDDTKQFVSLLNEFNSLVGDYNRKGRENLDATI